ncbi:hypothetical protein [Aestuariibaculum suncheonense]|nr:hypothetical protein [Aestuariibaculum suncheonense]
MNKFKIFIPEKRHIFNIDFFISIAFVSSIILIILIDNESQFAIIPLGLFVSTVISMFIIKLINNFRYQNLNGKFDGELIFSNDKIILGKETILLSSIKDVRIYNRDYKGKYAYRKTFKPKLLQGVENEIKIELLNGNIIVKRFLQTKKNEISKVFNVLKKYHLQDKIHFLHLIEVMGINDYDEIQDLKRALKTSNH